MRDNFSTFHPLVNFCYFGVIFILTMCIMHPLYLFGTFFSQSLYALLLNGRGFLRQGKYFLPLIIFSVIINACFNHRGATILSYFPSGNPLTLESLVYALAAAIVLSNMLICFSCFSKVITNEKFIYLFGRIFPSLALILSMTLRFIPKFKQKLTQIRQSRLLLGEDLTQGSLFSRLKHALSIFSILLTWSLENALITADSMKSRGYGSAKRTAFSLYRFERRDCLLLLIMSILGALLVCGIGSHAFAWQYFPSLSPFSFNISEMLTFAAYMLFSLIPIFCHLLNRRPLPSFRSKRGVCD